MTPPLAPTKRKFDAQMYAAALAYYGLPTNYNRTFKQKLLFDKLTNEPKLDKKGKQESTLISCAAGKESAQGNSVWVQVNQVFEGSAVRVFKNDDNEYTYPKKAANADIQFIANITLDAEYPPQPEIALNIARGLAVHLVKEGLAENGLPIENSGAGFHFVLPIPAIETTPATAAQWNDAVHEVVKTHIQPMFDQLVAQSGIKMDLGGYDISRVLSAPGTWRPYRPDKEDCAELREGCMRSWCEPYVDGNYPQRRESTKLAGLIREAYEQLSKVAAAPARARTSTVSNTAGKTALWLANYAAAHAHTDRSTHFHALVREVYRKYGEDMVHELRDQINELSGEKYNGRLPQEIERSLSQIREQVELMPKINIVGQLRDVTQQALDALELAEKSTPSIFVQSGRLVQIAYDEEKRPIIKTMTISELRNALTRSANYIRIREKAGTFYEVAVSPSKELAESIIAFNPIEWPFPPLKAVVEMPIIRSDGSILDKPGYDPATKIYYAGNDIMSACSIPLHPTETQVQDAYNLIESFIGEFPYEAQADHANAFALLLTLVTRYMYNSDVQTALINATKQGAGKTLLAIIACIIATNRPPALTGFPSKEEETKKVIDSKVLSGASLIVFDNVKRKFESTALDQLVTGNGWYSVRPLGQTKDVPVEVHCTVIATGNNMQLDTDQARRCFQIRLASPVSNPDEREDITIKDLIEHTTAHRAELVVALLTLVRAWFVAGKPAASNKLARSASTFRRWANTVGGILEFAGISGFQENRDELKAEANTEEVQIASFLQVWHDYKKEPIPAVEIIRMIKDAADTETKNLELDFGDKLQNNSQNGSDKLQNKLQQKILQNPALLQNLPDTLKESFFAKEKSLQSLTLIFTKWLRKRLKTPYGKNNLHIEQSDDTKKCSKEWRVVAGVAGVAGVQSGSITREKNNAKNNLHEGNISDSQQSISTPATPATPAKFVCDQEDRAGKTSSPSSPAQIRPGDKLVRPDYPNEAACEVLAVSSTDYAVEAHGWKFTYNYAGIQLSAERLGA